MNCGRSVGIIARNVQSCTKFLGRSYVHGGRKDIGLLGVPFAKGQVCNVFA